MEALGANANGEAPPNAELPPVAYDENALILAAGVRDGLFGRWIPIDLAPNAGLPKVALGGLFGRGAGDLERLAAVANGDAADAKASKPVRLVPPVSPAFEDEASGVDGASDVDAGGVVSFRVLELPKTLGPRTIAKGDAGEANAAKPP